MPELSSRLDNQEWLGKIRSLVLKELSDVDARIYLFGSWARGEQRRTSDIDIAIEHYGNITPFMIAKIRELLEESDVPYHVDVVDLTKAGAALAQRVREEGLLWKDYVNG